jgi:hypothetical protein
MTDLSTWLTESEAAECLGISIRTLQRKCAAGEGPERRERQRPGRKPEPVYNPEDVDRLATSPPAVFSSNSAIAPRVGNDIAPPGSIIEQLAAALHKRLQEPPPRPPARWLDLRAASARTGLSVALLRRLIASGRLKVVRDRSLKVLQSDIDNLDNSDMELVKIGGIVGMTYRDNFDKAVGIDGIVGKGKKPGSVQ